MKTASNDGSTAKKNDEDNVFQKENPPCKPGDGVIASYHAPRGPQGGHDAPSETCHARVSMVASDSRLTNGWWVTQ